MIRKCGLGLDGMDRKIQGDDTTLKGDASDATPPGSWTTGKKEHSDKALSCSFVPSA